MLLSQLLYVDGAPFGFGPKILSGNAKPAHDCFNHVPVRCPGGAHRNIIGRTTLRLATGLVPKAGDAVDIAAADPGLPMRTLPDLVPGTVSIKQL